MKGNSTLRASVRQTALRGLTISALLVPLLARPNTITVIDTDWAAPIVTTDFSGRVFTTPDTALVNAMVASAPGSMALPIGIHSLLLLDPRGNNVSDFFSLDVSARVHGMQRVSLLFESESAPGFAAAVAALRGLPGTTATRESAGLLNLSALLDSGALSVQFDSEPRSVPDHNSTLALFGTALLVTCGFVRLTKSTRARSVQPAI